MSGSGLGGIAAAVITVVLAFVTGIAVLTGGTASPSCVPATTATTSPAGAVGVFDTEQVTNAATITAVVAGLGLPRRAAVIAVAVAITESSLRNVDHGDVVGPDSRGLFQQRAPWGPEAVRMNPAGATELFLTGGRGGQPGLVDIPGWDTLPLARAAQAVQRSALPDAYAQNEASAQMLVNTVAPGAKAACPLPGSDGGLPEGFTLPENTPGQVQVAIGWALAQLGTSYFYGGDCTDPHGPNETRHCDCSSLTMRAYAAAGVPLPRTAAAQSRTGTGVSDPTDLRPGDLVLLSGAHGTRADPGHVALYLGQGLVVEAPGTGLNVRVAPLYRASDIVAVRRPVL